MQYILYAILFVAGIYTIFSAAFPIASRHAVEAVTMQKTHGYNKKYARLLDVMGQYIRRYYKLPEHKADRYKKMLQAAGIKYSPDEFASRLIGQSLLYGGVGLLLYPLSPVLAFSGLAFGVYTHYTENDQLKKKYLKHQEEIELDLPKLCSVINARLRTTKNVQAILESFMTIASPAMQDEITLTVADMKTGNHEMALRRFEGRLSSPKVSDVVRGLVSVMNGDDQTVFFQSKQHQFNNDYLTIKKKEIQKRPMKLTMPSMVAFLFFFLIIFYPVLMSMGTIINQIL